MHVPLETLALIMLVTFAGYVIFGMTGFGASPITIPVLAHFLPLPFVLALCSVLDLTTATLLGYRTRREAEKRELLALLPFTLAGVALGVTLLVNLPREATLAGLGLFVCGYALYAASRRPFARTLSRAWAAPLGLAGGLFGALFGVGGPPYVVYVTGRVPKPAAQRATIVLMVIVSVGLRVIAFATAGLFAARGLAMAAAALLPVAWLGLWVGHRIHLGAPPGVLARIVAVVLFVSGASLLYRSLGGIGLPAAPV
ncbi:sulfite exporter TauE/SafE family protein [Pelomicrobium sp.]|jgi:uncharacterized membrane protein YfcA|uniref:sulfite exporter TauE/SafE family protein n=1 Tax=Pelomicrobium sp. TaxID=2815319 RepID=UPI002FDE8941